MTWQPVNVFLGCYCMLHVALWATKAKSSGNINYQRGVIILPNCATCHISWLFWNIICKLKKEKRKIIKPVFCECGRDIYGRQWENAVIPLKSTAIQYKIYSKHRGRIILCLTYNFWNQESSIPFCHKILEWSWTNYFGPDAIPCTRHASGMSMFKCLSLFFPRLTLWKNCYCVYFCKAL